MINVNHNQQAHFSISFQFNSHLCLTMLIIVAKTAREKKKCYSRKVSDCKLTTEAKKEILQQKILNILISPQTTLILVI